jgi:hypothetical protein
MGSARGKHGERRGGWGKEGGEEEVAAVREGAGGLTQSKAGSNNQPYLPGVACPSTATAKKPQKKFV